MLHNTLSALLVSLTSRYAQLSPSDVGIGIGGGRLVIDNVELRADTFNGPHLPFHVHQGRAGRLRVNVPWRALSSTPVQLYLENVHLIAGPKSTPSSDADVPAMDEKASSNTASSKHPLSKPPPPPLPPMTSRDQSQVPWHQTNIGRLLFNVSVEIYGLKIEYRDDDCIAIMSVASLRAFSAGPDWTMRFVSFTPDLDHERPDATAVSMRKTVNLNGVHIVMIPRVKPGPDMPHIKSTFVNSVNPETAAEVSAENNENAAGLSDSKNGTSPKAGSDHPDRNLDLNSFESKSPILDGVSISLRVLLCTGATNLATAPDVLTPGMHGEVSIEIDDPTVKLTARQLIWLDNIFKQALSVVQVEPSDVTDTLRYPRGPNSETGSNTSSKNIPNNEEFSTHKQIESGKKAVNGLDAEASSNAVVNGEGHYRTQAQNNRRRKRTSGFMSVWEAIVGENSDETVDDAAIALGLRDADEYDEGTDAEDVGDAMDLDEDDGEDKLTGISVIEHSKVGRNGLSKDKEYGSSENAEKQYARRMVATAAQSGGVTWEVRLRTTDTQAWDRVHQLEREVSEAQTRLEDAETRVGRANKVELQARETLERAENAERRADELIERNAALVSELKELERLTGEAGRTKDEMIRQTQDALAEAESRLRTFFEKEKVTSVAATSTDNEHADVARVQEEEMDGVSSVALRDGEKTDETSGDHSAQDGVVILHDVLDVENEGGTENISGASSEGRSDGEGGTEDGSRTPNSSSEDSSNRGSVIVHETFDTHEPRSVQGVGEDDVAWFNEAGKLGSGTERTDEPSVEQGEGVEGHSDTRGIRDSEDTANTLVEVDFQEVNAEKRQHESGKNDDERNLTDDGKLPVSTNIEAQGMLEQSVTSEQEIILEDVHQIHMSNFESLQQKMGHEGLTLI